MARFLALLLTSTGAMAQNSTVKPNGADPSIAGSAQTSNSPSGQDVGLQEVIVTATREGATQLQRTPIAVTVFSAQALDESGNNNIKDVAELAPNVSFEQSTTSALVYIRGVGTNLLFGGSDPDVITQMDGVYLARSFEAFADFLDVDRVEILRGPQGTLYGRNAVGGVVNIISRAPTDDFEAREEVTVGNYGLFQEAAFVSGALVKGVLDGSISINYLRHDGYNNNLVAGGPDTDNANHGGVRVQLRWMPTDRIDATTRLDYSAYDEAVASYDHILAPEPFPVPLADSTIGQYHTIAMNSPQFSHEDVGGVAEEVNIKLDEATSLKSLTAYRFGWDNNHYDLDATELTVNNVFGDDHSEQFSQEFDVTGHFRAWDYVAGLYYFHEIDDEQLVSESPPSIHTVAPAALYIQVLPTADSRSKAAFAQGAYHLTDTLKITAGVRYTADNKEFGANTSVASYSAAPVIGPPFPGFPFIAHVDPTFSAVTPKGSIDWQATDNALLYFTYAQGYKSGGNNATATSLVGISFRPEKLTSYEGGVKTEWFDHRLRLNLTGFYYDYTDLQVVSLVSDGVTATSNAASATIKGIEFEASARPMERLLLDVNVGFLDAKYGTYTTDTVPVALVASIKNSPLYDAANGTYNASGNTLNSAPRFSASLAAQYTQPIPQGDVYERSVFRWQDTVSFDPTNAPIMSQGPYGVLDLAVGYHSPGSVWTAELLGKNVLNKDYWVTTAANSIVPSAVSGAPRTVMLRVGRNFK
jgi:iron complex outermembrane recepter protein